MFVEVLDLAGELVALLEGVLDFGETGTASKSLKVIDLVLLHKLPKIVGILRRLFRPMQLLLQPRSLLPQLLQFHFQKIIVICFLELIIPPILNLTLNLLLLLLQLCYLLDHLNNISGTSLLPQPLDLLLQLPPLPMQLPHLPLNLLHAIRIKPINLPTPLSISHRADHTVVPQHTAVHRVDLFDAADVHAADPERGFEVLADDLAFEQLRQEGLEAGQLPVEVDDVQGG